MPITRRALLLGSAFPLFAQEPRFSTGIDVVTVYATVRDREGRVVKDLDREDFTLHDQGEKVEIRYFSRESDLPLTIGLLVDTSRSQIPVLEAERRASYRFLDQMLREDRDRAFVSSFDTRVHLLQGFTSSRQELSEALEKLKVPWRVATLLYQAIRTNSENQMRRQEGRKAFILLSDGMSALERCTISTAIEYAQRADTIIFSILYAPPQRRKVARFQKRGPAVMLRLARETGGAYFDISDSLPIEKAYADIEDILRNQYSIGYKPPAGGKSGEYRKIKLTARGKDLIVHARDGYYVR